VSAKKGEKTYIIFQKTQNQFFLFQMMQMSYSNGKMVFKFGKIPFYYRQNGIALDALVYNPSTIPNNKRLKLLASMSNGITSKFGKDQKVMVFNDIILNAGDLLGAEFVEIGKRDEAEYMASKLEQEEIYQQHFVSDVSEWISELCFQNKSKLGDKYYQEVMSILHSKRLKMDDEMLQPELDELIQLRKQVETRINVIKDGSDISKTQ